MTTVLVETTTNAAEVEMLSDGKIVRAEFHPASCRVVYDVPAEAGTIIVRDLPAYEPEEAEPEEQVQ